MTIAMDERTPHQNVRPDVSDAPRIQRSALTPIHEFSNKATASDISGYRGADDVVMLVKSPVISAYDAAYMEGYILFLERSRLCLADSELASRISIPEHSPIWVENGSHSKLSIHVRYIDGRTLGEALKFQSNLEDTPEQRDDFSTLITVATNTLKYLDQFCLDTIGSAAADRRIGSFGDDFENFVIPAECTQGDNFRWRFTDPAQAGLVNIDPICHSRYYKAINSS